MIMGKALAKTARRMPDKTAIIAGDATWTYAQFNDRVNRLAHALTRLGLAKGEMAAVLALNCPEYLEAYHAMAKLGVVMVPINHRLKPKEVFYRLAHSRSRALILGREFIPVLETMDNGLAEQLKGRVLVLGGDPPVGMRSYEGELDRSPGHEPQVEVVAEDPLFIGYTGGTTGRSKGAVISNRAIVAGYLYKVLEYRYDEGEVTLNPGPFWHTAPRNCSLAFYLGGSVVVEPGFEPRAYMEAVRRHGVTSSFLVPTMFRAMLDLPGQEDYDLSSLKVLTSGGAPMDAALKRRVLDRFGPVVWEHYASTETLILCTIGPDEMLDRPRSVGRPSWDVYLKLVDDHGAEVPQGEVGEVMIQGPSLLSGYLDDPERTAQCYRDGWFTLGDMGYFDQEGYLYLVDRKKDMVISGGENIYPSEVEECLRQHPGVDQVAVIGVPDDKWGEALKAVIVPNNGHKLDEAEVLEFCAQRLAGYLKPRSVELVSELPVSPVGKILKRKLREKYWQGRDTRV